MISVRGQFLNREVGADRFAAPAARLCRTYRQTLRERHVGWIPRYSPGKHAGNARHGDARESERERRWGLSLSLGTSLRSVIAEFRSTGCSFVRATVSTGLPPSTGSQQSAVNARLKSSDGRSLKSATIPYSTRARHAIPRRSLRRPRDRSLEYTLSETRYRETALGRAFSDTATHSDLPNVVPSWT